MTDLLSAPSPGKPVSSLTLMARENITCEASPLIINKQAPLTAEELFAIENLKLNNREIAASFAKHSLNGPLQSINGLSKAFVKVSEYDNLIAMEAGIQRAAFMNKHPERAIKRYPYAFKPHPTFEEPQTPLIAPDLMM